MIKINYYHSLIFFNFCIFLSAFEYLRSNSLLVISLLLILSIGISHGSLDHIKGRKLLKILGFKSSYIFYISYIMIGLITVIIWLQFPKILLFFFLRTFFKLEPMYPFIPVINIFNLNLFKRKF